MRDPSRRTVILGIVGLAVLAVPGATAVVAAETKPLAIKGYDPVAYFTLGRAARGSDQIAFEWDDHRYLFASAAHRDLFKADPARYAPQFANYCAMALTRGEITEADPESWLIVDGRLYIFGKAVGPDLFREDLAGNIAKANQKRFLLPLN
jgi:hypothetical protein